MRRKKNYAMMKLNVSKRVTLEDEKEKKLCNDET